ncbi:MAG TPA: hypothetical protein VGX76_06055 [Pirellulales bacterium]|jgi:hypothetical protein|nr:hypothetical protein [Pirellulales bacterium]
MEDRTLAHRNDTGAYTPTAAEIEAAAAEIRATWSDHEFRKRLGLPADDGVEVTVVRERELWPNQ